MPGRIWRFEIEQEPACLPEAPASEARGGRGSVLILNISGRIGSAAAPKLHDALVAALAAAPAVVVDLRNVDYISGPGLVALQRAVAARNGAFVLCSVTEPVQIALELAGLASELPIEADRTAAIARLRA